MKLSAFTFIITLLFVFSVVSSLPLKFDKYIIRNVNSELLTKRRCSGKNYGCGPSTSSKNGDNKDKGLLGGRILP
ncbi:1765_t:CDS:2 [Funneliformis geosporum]|nr:1765_t:CDS:2 [Funneliformis geosporum]